MTIVLHEVVIDHSAGWGKWPNTEDIDYSYLVKTVHPNRVRHADGALEEIHIHSHTYPAYLPFLRSGNKSIEHKQFPWQINVNYKPPTSVLEQQLADLREYSKTCSIIRWRHGYECYPEVSSQLAELFPLRIFEFSDDCIGSSEIKSFPHAAYFNALLHNMYIWEYNSGTRVSDKYHSLGMKYTAFAMLGPSTGLYNYLERSKFDVQAKIDAIRAGAPFDIGLASFSVMGHTNSHRIKFMQQLEQRRGELHDAGLVTKLCGPNWGDGIVQPYRSPEGDGCVVGEQYSRTLLGPNFPVSSLFNSRLFDLWLMGVGQMVFDKNKELADFGLKPGVHYIPFDGSVHDCITRAIQWANDRPALANVLQHAHRAVVRLLEKHRHARVLTQTYLDHLDVLL